MSSSLPKIANSDQFVNRGEFASGKVSLAQLPRLADYLPEGFDVAQAELLTWSVRGIRDPLGRRALEIVVRGMVPVTCQRCLKMFLWPIDRQSTVLIAKTQEELIALDEASDLEVVLCDHGLDVQTLVEDELLLSLPFSPLHDICPDEGSSDN